jgi:predicted transglutaminase-like cysteine proteinase
MPADLARGNARAAGAAPAATPVRARAWGGLRRPAALLLGLLVLSATQEAAAKPAHAGPFATAGAYSTDFTGFPKWRGMLDRFARELSEPDSADVQVWHAFARSLAVRDMLAQLSAVNAAVNAFPYVSDEANWGKIDFWETPVEFLHRAGDCEDFAVTKYMALRELGVAADAMRVVVVDDNEVAITHAVLVVAADGTYYVLDNLKAAVEPITALASDRPIYAINEHGWWNYGPPPAVSAAGP